MVTPNPNERSGDPPASNGIRGQVEHHLDTADAWEDTRATEDDFVIMQCLLRAIRAARRKGYSEELLITVLRGLNGAPPGSS